MLHLRRARSLWVAASLALAALASSGSASARALQVRDEAHVLTPEDVTRLRSEVASAPFDARLVLTTEHSDAQELARYLHQFVSEADMVVVGVDPEHHHVQVRFGAGSHVPQTSWNAIEKSGNDAFHRGDWEGGAAAIFRAASAAVSIGASGPVGSTERAEQAPAGPGLALLVIGGFVGIALLAAFFLRRRGVAPAPGAYAPGFGQPPYGGGGYGYGPPAGGMGPLGGGIIGAGLGGLAGYELGKLEGEREERGRDGAPGGGSSSGDAADNYDAGGGGSDWDSGGGGGGGFDGGGGGGADF